MSDKSLNDIDIINAMESVSVLVVGDIMLDRFVYGAVERISPESPVPILSIARENVMLGGAGNALSNLVHLYCKAQILSIIGDDENGVKIKELVHKAGVETTGLITSPDHRSIVKTRFLAGHQQLLRTDYERTDNISPELSDLLLEKARAFLPSTDAIILSDYGKGLLTKDFLTSFIALAKEHDVPILVDPKGTNYSIYKGVDVVTPNKKELSEATNGMAVGTDAQIVKAAQSLMTSSGIHAVIATRSQDGMSVIRQDHDAVHIKSASDIEVFDVSGAGDSVIATIAASLAAGADLVQAASLANIAGSIVVSKVGTAPIRAQELVDAVQNQDGAVKSQNNICQVPVLNWEEAQEIILRWKARGLKVGFTNGCFDILHFGHVTYLNDARTKCDRLVIGLNSDASVKILKGPARPVHDEQSRAAVLAALGSVHMVVLFGATEEEQDNTACDLLAMLQPDIYFKGGDYTINQIPEAPTVKHYGGRVDIMPVYEGHSTTHSIKKL